MLDPQSTGILEPTSPLQGYTAKIRELAATDIREARRYLTVSSPQALEEFAVRQLGSRRRTTALLRFYRRFPCHMGRLHLLAACAVMLGRFAGISESFDRAGEVFMPVDPQGRPRTEAWNQYIAACLAGKSWEVRDELWLAAHMRDMESMREIGIDRAFHAEAALHDGELTWQLIRQHMDVTVGARLMDSAALSGVVAFETAMAQSLAVTIRQLFTRGLALVWRYAVEGARALLLPASEPDRDLLSYRRCALNLARYWITAWSASRVFRRGIRQRDRGSQADEEGWPLIERALGAGTREVHPAIIGFYANPSRYAVTASIELETLPARFWSRVATLLVGQGLYESREGEIPARFRVFRRADGSMHFVRELDCGHSRRVFDSDFIIRHVDGASRLFEVFTDIKVDVEMDVNPLPGGGLSIRGRNIYFRGIRMPSTGLKVEFRSRVSIDEHALPVIHIDGSLSMQPESAVGRFIMLRLLRRPEHLASIHYRAIAESASPEGATPLAGD
jgi:hypothetical protein